MKQESNGLNVSERSQNNGDDWFSMKFYYEVNEACDRFWANDRISHFVNGVPQRTGIPRKRPSVGFNQFKRTTIHRKGA